MMSSVPKLRRAAAIEIKIGQGTKPGMGGHLPGEKVTAEIAALRGKPVGEDIHSPSRFPGIDIDLSLVMPQGLTFAQLVPAWADMDPETLTSVTLIDSFQQNGVMSITLRFAFSSQERTLSKEEVQPWVDQIVEKVGKVGATLRA